jgi:hypothetical protein
MSTSQNAYGRELDMVIWRYGIRPKSLLNRRIQVSSYYYQQYIMYQMLFTGNIILVILVIVMSEDLFVSWKDYSYWSRSEDTQAVRIIVSVFSTFSYFTLGVTSSRNKSVENISEFKHL